MTLYFLVKILLVMSIQPMYPAPAPTLKPSLVYKVRPAKADLKNPPLLVLLHGVGSNEDDLLQMANYLDADYLIVSVRAPYTQSPGHYEWYDVDFSTGKPSINAVQAEASRKELIAFLDALKAELQYDEKNVFVGGFSQGGIMAYSVGLTSPATVAGIVSLSGRLLEEVKPAVTESSLSSLEALVIHGRKDRVLPIYHAQSAKAFLELKGVNTKYFELEIGHTINATVIQLLNQWLEKVKVN